MAHYVKVAVGLSNVTVGDQTGDAGDVLLISDEDYASIPAANLDGNPLIDLGEDVSGATVISIPVSLADLPAGAGDVVTNVPLQGRGAITQVLFLTTVPGAGAAAARALNLEIGSTNLTGGVLSLTLAATDTVGEVVSGTAITGNNVFNDGDTLSVEVAAGTVFTGGEGVLLITAE